MRAEVETFLSKQSAAKEIIETYRRVSEKLQNTRGHGVNDFIFQQNTNIKPVPESDLIITSADVRQSVRPFSGVDDYTTVCCFVC